MTVLYFDCFSGASGDMVLGALLDAGVPEDIVLESLSALHLEGWALDISTATKSGVRATKATVSTTGTGAERTYESIVDVLKSSSLAPKVLDRAVVVFDVLAQAEAKVHGKDARDVHFHEVGSLDAIIDIVGSCAALAHLAPDMVVTSSIPTGSGLIDSAHGRLPLPAPAVAEILSAHGAPLLARGTRELTTPTGAALLATWSNSFGQLPPMRVERIGYGAGSADDDIPNVLRVFVGQLESDATAVPQALLIETNVDDMSGELLPHVIERLMQEGAQDAWLTPITMKKGRPAHTISVLVDAGRRDAVLEVLFSETTTLGVRTSTVEKEILDREWTSVEVGGHPVRIKTARRRGTTVTMAPEYEDALAAATASGLSLKEVYERALSAARSQSPMT